MHASKPRGFTLVELLVVIAIIGVLVSLLLPAIQASREAARRNACRSKLAQVTLALQSYENAFERYPAGVTDSGGPIRSEMKGHHMGWLVQLLPYLDEAVVYGNVDQSQSVYSKANQEVYQIPLPVLICPSEPTAVWHSSSFAGCHHDVEAPIDANNNGVLFLNSALARRDISDGVSHTLFIGEKRMDGADQGWMSGTRATLRNTGLPINSFTPSGAVLVPGGDPAAISSALYVGGFGSAHVGGCHMSLGDASVTFVSDSIDPLVWQQLGHRADGKLLNYRVDE